jgi:hypothetical protein
MIQEQLYDVVVIGAGKYFSGCLNIGTDRFPQDGMGLELQKHTLSYILTIRL